MAQHLWHDWHEVRRKIDTGHYTYADKDREAYLRNLLFGAVIYRAEQAVDAARAELQAQRQRQAQQWAAQQQRAAQTPWDRLTRRAPTPRR